MIKQIFLTFIVVVVVLFGVYNFFPFKMTVLNPSSSGLLGSTITTILSTDTLKDSRTTINNNFTALNSTKMENSTSSVAAITTLSNLTTAGSLVTVGALSSGSLASGFTAVTVPLGGTGSTTLSSNQVLLGNGTSAIKMVSGWGSSGEVLTSNGGVLAPTWQASNLAFGSSTPVGILGVQGNAYISGTTTITNLNIASTTGIHSLGTNLQIPSDLGTFGMALPFVDMNIVGVGVGSSGTTTLYTKKLDANFLKTNTAIQITSAFDTSTAGSGCGYGIQIGDGNGATTTIGYAFGNQPKIINSFFLASTTRQYGGGISSSGVPGITSSSTAFSLSSPLYLAFTGSAIGANQSCYLEGYIITRLGN